MSYYINVILPVPIDQYFSYEITDSEFKFIKVGSRVAVPFGKNRIITGIVSKLHQEAPSSYDVKPIHQIIDEAPIINNNQLEFWEWMSKYYMCPIGDVMKASIPSVLLIESETIISLNKNSEIDQVVLTDEEFLIFEALLSASELTINEISEILNKKNVFKFIKSLNEKHVIEIDEKLYSKYKPKLKRCVELNKIYSNEDNISNTKESLKRSPKQSELFLQFLNLNLNDFISIEDLKKKINCSSNLIKQLIDKNIFIEHYVEINRFETSNLEIQPINKLSDGQERAYNEIIKSFKIEKPALLHGVTSSGKTEVYVKLIKQALDQKGQVLYLVPEIALTTQVVKRLTDFFGDKVLVYHSGYSINQRVEVWSKISTNNSSQLIIGARSSLLMPFKNLKLIIVDEEHEQSYKQQEPSPRYHARDASLILSRIFKANILLGSATPSVESYNNAINLNKYTLVELKNRFNNVLMPIVELVDLKFKYARKLMNGHFSDSLINEIFNTVSNHKQVILYQNRRGFSPIVECEDCGVSPHCVNCDVSLTFHLNTNSLKCHYCGFGVPLIKSCRSCNSNNIITVGFGTEQVEEDVKALFPNFRVERLD
jgi:primosomal protein N' (replication factor Y)